MPLHLSSEVETRAHQLHFPALMCMEILSGRTQEMMVLLPQHNNSDDEVGPFLSCLSSQRRSATHVGVVAEKYCTEQSGIKYQYHSMLRSQATGEFLPDDSRSDGITRFLLV